MTCRHAPIRWTVLTTLLIGVCIGGCTREKPREPAAERPVATENRAIPKAPTAAHDVTGKKRGGPRTTMGALEADPGAPLPPKKPPKRLPKS